MTVCIGAVCDNGKSVVVAADRMMTYGPPISLQVEMAVKKIVPVSDTCAILFSGAVPDGEEIIGRTKRRLNDGISISEVAQIAASCYQEVKNQRVEETILKPWLGIGFAAFPGVMSQAGSSQIMQQIIGMVMQHNLQLDLLVAGINEGHAHLCAVVNPGVSLGLDTIGCSAIGSGGLHANVRLALGKQGTTVNLSETIYNVYEAKLAAEAAPGVGKLSDIAVILDGKTKFLDESALDMLASMQNALPRLMPASLAQLDTLVKDMING